MTWIETTSLTFTARHEDADRTYAEELLDRLEDLSLKLEDRFEVVPGDVSIVIHPSPVWLTAAHPFLPFVRYAAAPAGRRYLAGWPMATEVHVLGEKAMEKRAAGEASAEALRGTAERLYTQIVLAEESGTTVIYVWDVLDASGNRLHRIQGRQTNPGFDEGDAWRAVTPGTMQAVGVSSIDQLRAWLAT